MPRLFRVPVGRLCYEQVFRPGTLLCEMALSHQRQSTWLSQHPQPSHWAALLWVLLPSRSIEQKTSSPDVKRITGKLNNLALLQLQFGDRFKVM